MLLIKDMQHNGDKVEKRNYMMNVLGKYGSFLLWKHANRIIWLIIHIALIRTAIQKSEEMPTVFQQQD